MILVTYDWHAFNTYEWWRDIGLPIVGAASSTLVGVVALVIAGRSHGLAKRTTDFAEAVQAAEDQRAREDERREQRRQRADFALLARRLNTAQREAAWNEPSTIDGMDISTFEAHMRDVAAPLADPVSAEYLIDRIVSRWSPILYPPVDRIDSSRRLSAGTNWRAVEGEIGNYVQQLPMSKPHWREQNPLPNPAADLAQAKTEAYRQREANRDGDS